MNKPIPKNTRVKSTKITRSAKGRECAAMIPGVCNRDNSTVILAHLNGAGMGIKHHDFHGLYSCSDCHDWLDGGFLRCKTMKIYTTDVAIHIRNSIMLKGMIITHNILLNIGLIEVKK